MMVVIGHVYLAGGRASFGAVTPVLGQLGSGVDLFFVLSGFCLYYPLTKPGATFSVLTFFRRRARRILPPYYATIAAVLALPPIIGPPARRLGLIVFTPQHISWQQIGVHLLLIHTLFPSTFFTIDGPFWSLGVEMQFYLAFPLAVWLVHRYGWGGLALMGLTTVVYLLAVSAMAHAEMAPIYLTGGNATLDVKELFFPGRWLEFGLGMLVALLVRQRRIPAIGPRRELAALVGCACMWAAAMLFLQGAPDRWLLPVANPLYGLAFALLLLVACTPGTYTGRLLGHPAPVWIGTISYSLYLVHLPILLALAPSIIAWRLGDLATCLVIGALGIPLVLACAAIFFRLFERPFLNAMPATAATRDDPAVHGEGTLPVALARE